MSLLDQMNKSNFEKHPGVTFPKLGCVVDGIITGEPREVQMPDMNDPSKTVTKYVFDLTLNQPTWTGTADDPEESPAGTLVTLWAQKQMAGAIAKAAKKIGASDIAEGGRLVVRWSDKRKIEGRPKPQKIYEAEYTPPVRSISTSALTGDDDDEG